ncbi:MAG TPA: PQQ-dependent sugar dehydrogenase, partial [Gemmataceae bacterium]|nr:PQQ-dependent sugar dehydrogenase [Gemmataceae bacterium]
WALGLRNPYTFAFQPGTGRLFINDVGQVLWEEIDEGVAGGNYGWPIYEGPSNPPDPRFIDPVFAYPHNGASAAIVGGAFYNPTTVLFPTEDVGDYFFADFVQGFIKQLDVTTRAVSDFASGIANPVDLKVNADGSLYYLASGSGELVRVQHPPPSPPPPPPSPTPPGASSVGVFDPATGNWYIRNNNSSGAPDITPFAYGAAGWVPLAGDWDGNASVTLGVFDPNTAIWYLRNSNSAGAPDFTPFAYGAPGWIPIVGDWDGDGITTIGVFDPSTATWYLRNSNSPGAPSITPFRYGGAGWLPAVGDWDGDRTTTIGVVDPATETWYLKNSNSAGAPDITPFAYGAPGWVPVAGDWDADGRESVGVFDPTSATWYLRNTNSGGAPDITPFAYGGANWKPVPAPWGRSVGVQPAARELWLDALAAATLL